MDSQAINKLRLELSEQTLSGCLVVIGIFGGLLMAISEGSPPSLSSMGLITLGLVAVVLLLRRIQHVLAAWILALGCSR